MPRKESPLSSTSIGNLLGAIFLFTNMICVLLGASCIIWVFICYFATIILAVHNFWERHTWFGNYYNTLYASVISFELYCFCSSTSLISFRARWWICFIETIVLSCSTYIILRVLQNSMVICFNYFRHSRLIIKFSYECVEYYEKFETW